MHDNHVALSVTVFLLTPPFTQLNTPYPATAYLKGFLNTKNITSFQADLGIEVTLAIFSKKGLLDLFSRIESLQEAFSPNANRMMALKDDYIHTIDAVISFLQGKNPTLAHRIEKRDFLPEASRFSQSDDLGQAFGSMGSQDKAKYLATMYLEDIADLIKECIDPHFGFSRYAEKLGRSANSFDELYESLQQPYTYMDAILLDILDGRMKEAATQTCCNICSIPGKSLCILALRAMDQKKLSFNKSGDGWRLCQYRIAFLNRSQSI